MPVDLRGWLLSDTGLAVPSKAASAYVSGTVTPAASAVTDAAGLWAFPSLAEATYDVKVQALGKARWLRGGRREQFSKVWIVDELNLGAAVSVTGLSHTGLTDIGTNTHAQIDTHIASTFAPTAYPYLGIGTHADLSAEVDVQSMQLINEIKGWPPIVAPDADLDALNLWWDQIGTPTTAPTVVDLAGEAGITETYELALKCVTDAASEGLSQRWTYADEPRVKSGRKLSVLLAIWSVSAVSVTAKLVNSDASETAASAVTAAAWTLVEIANHTLAGTYCDLQVTAAAAGTFYVVPLGACIGSRGLPLAPRPLRYKEAYATPLSNVDPADTSWTDVDLTASTSPLAVAAFLWGLNQSSSANSRLIYVRRNGSAEAANLINQISQGTSTLLRICLARVCWLDDNQVYEYSADNAEANTVYQFLYGYWEWA